MHRPLSEPTRPDPIPVEIRQPNPGALQTLSALISPLIDPLATTGIVVIFVIFILFQQNDLRNRLVRLMGAQDLQRTTAALDDAGERLSRLFLTQLALNAIFELVIGVGLWVIGVPSAPLWGMMAMILRFVPYIGAVIAAIFPLILAGLGRSRVDNGCVDRGPFPDCRNNLGSSHRTTRIQPKLRPISSGRHCLRELLDLAMGSHRPDPGDAIDNLSDGAGTPYGSPQLSRSSDSATNHR